MWPHHRGCLKKRTECLQGTERVLRLLREGTDSGRRKTKKNMAAKFHEFTAKLLTGETFNFSSLKGKVVLIENVASLWGTTTRDYTQMNELHARYASKGLVILGVPCNQFGHQVRKSTLYLPGFLFYRLSGWLGIMIVYVYLFILFYFTFFHPWFYFPGNSPLSFRLQTFFCKVYIFSVNWGNWTLVINFRSTGSFVPILRLALRSQLLSKFTGMYLHDCTLGLVLIYTNPIKNIELSGLMGENLISKRKIG